MSRDAAGKPAEQGADTLTLEYLDSPDFLQRHALAEADGTSTVKLHVGGLHCAACSWLVEQVAAGEPGVSGVDGDLPRTSLKLQIDPAVARLSSLATTLNTFGYTVQPTDGAKVSGDAQRSLLVRAGVCWAIAGNVMLLAFALYAGLEADLGSGVRELSSLASAARWASMALAAGTLLVGGTVFFRRATASLTQAWKTRNLLRLHMDVPISLGILVGFFASVVNTVGGSGQIWFDSIAVLIAALLTARWLQVRGQERAKEASDRLFAVIPRVARRVTGGRQEEIVPIDEIATGDLLRVEPGESCPADGRVVSGRSHFNESVLTGESRPVPAVPGDAVSAGAINLSETLVVRADAAGDDSQVGRMLRWLDDNRARRAGVVMMADRVAGWFVIGVIAMALATGLVGAYYFPAEAVTRVVALLVIACPCALGMATPLAMVTARGRAARRGSLVKDDASLETLSHVQTVIFDKTGTLTTGRLVVVSTAGDETALPLAANLERNSRHPVAQALVSTYGGSATADRAASDVSEHWGYGIEGVVDGHPVLAGNPSWIGARCSPNEALATRAAAIASAGHTPVAIGVDSEWRAVVGFGDPIRPEAKATISALKKQGKNVFLLSGDHPDVAQRVGAELGLDSASVRGGASPTDKERYVTELRRASRVAMVGDGINDATAMRAADIGLALGSRNAPAVVAADVLVNGTRVNAVDELLDLAGNTRRVVRANLSFSLLYNVGGAAAAAVGLVTPLAAAIAMPISSLIVVATSLSLNYSARIR